MRSWPIGLAFVLTLSLIFLHSIPLVAQRSPHDFVSLVAQRSPHDAVSLVAQYSGDAPKGAANKAPKSMIPPARPPGANGQKPQAPVDEPFKVEIWVETDAQKYFFKEDLETWPWAVHEFALKVKSEFDDFRDSRLISLDWELTDVWDYVEGRLDAVLENQTELSLSDEDNLEMAFIEEYFLTNLGGLAIDENGAYFMMPLVDNPENGEWIKTPLNANGPSGSYYREGAGALPSRESENNLRRFNAAREAWKRDPQ
jgi:hypothetical protein